MLKDFLRGSDGVSVIEVALLMPVFLLLLVGGVDFGRAYYVQMEVQEAANAGAQYGVLNPSDTAGMIAAAKLNASDLSSFSPTATTGCECSDGSSSVSPCSSPAPTCTTNLLNYVQVKTSYTYTMLLQYPGVAKTLTLSSQSTMRAAH